jgi:hypothetical protein
VAVTDSVEETVAAIAAIDVPAFGCMGSDWDRAQTCPADHIGDLLFAARRAHPDSQRIEKLLRANYDDGRACPAPYTIQIAREMLADSPAGVRTFDTSGLRSRRRPR